MVPGTFRLHALHTRERGEKVNVTYPNSAIMNRDNGFCQVHFRRELPV